MGDKLRYNRNFLTCLLYRHERTGWKRRSSKTLKNPLNVIHVITKSL